MNANQVSMLREFNLKDDGTGKPLAGSLSVVFNNELAFSSNRDYVIYDDENELVHAIKANTEHPVDQSRWPYRIMTGYYGNAQYMEAMYDMPNFRKAIQGLFVDTGLISQEKADMIINWAQQIQNQTIVPKQPGPYFKDTVLPVGKQPVDERRPDGLFHGAPTNHYSNINKLESLVYPIIDSSPIGKKRLFKGNYKYTVASMDEMVSELISVGEKIIAAVKDVYLVSITDDINAAIYNPAFKKSIEEFKKDMDELRITQYGRSKNIKIYVEAFNVRICVRVLVTYSKDNSDDPSDKPMTQNEFKKYVTDAFNEFIDNYETDTDMDIKRNGYSVDMTLRTLDISGDIERFTTFLTSMSEVDMFTVTLGSGRFAIDIEDPQSIENFKKGVINYMPTENAGVANGTVVADGHSAKVNYKLRVRYYNALECEAKIGDVYYNTLNEAIAMGGEVTVLLDVNDDIVVPAGTNVVLNTNGKTITGKTTDTITNHGVLTIKGIGTIDSTIHRKAALYNAPDGVIADITEATFTRSAENSDLTETGNSWYVVVNDGNIMKISGGNFISTSTRSSMIINRGSKAKKARIGEITNATFNGKYCLLKNEGTGVVDKIGVSNWSASGYTANTKVIIQNTGTITEIDGATFTGGNNTIYNAAWKDTDTGDTEVGVCTIKGSTTITPESGNAVRCCFIGDAFDAVPTVTIENGNINGSVKGDEGCSIVVMDGTYAEDPSAYVVVGYKAILDTVSGKWVIERRTAPDAAVEDIINKIDVDGVSIEKDASEEGTYNIITSVHSLDVTNLFDDLAVVPDLISIEVTDGETTATYEVDGGDLEAFKDAVDAMLPKTNADPEVILSMTVTSKI